MKSGKTKKKIREMRVGDRVEADHQPMEIVIKGLEKWR